jgi:hypothetical protein
MTMRGHMPAMFTRHQWRKFIDHPAVEWSLFVIGVILLVLSPVVGLIPGPGGIVVAGIGLALILRTSMWAKRYYARFKRVRLKVGRRYFMPGRWTDLALRRRSALRRERLRKEQETEMPASETGRTS